VILATLLLLAGKLTPDTVQVKVDGAERLAYVFAPTSKSTSKPPVLFMFHGHGGSAQRCIERFGVEKRWPEAVVVYCDGLPVTTAGGNGKGWELQGNATNRDVKFFDALLPQVLSKYQGDPKKVFAWGFSNGGMFIYTLWSMRPDKFAAFCPSGSCIQDDDVQLRTPKPAFVTISANDNIVPTELQEEAFKKVLTIDHSESSGKPFGDGGTYYRGKQPVVCWRYSGGHEFPFESFPKLIEFFKGVRNGPLPDGQSKQARPKAGL
jgi:polyhydroxybutyrate depolymerase